jgi:ABC-2 type transport system ATP-binding protein
MPMEPAIEAAGLGRRFGRTVALDSINLSVKAGELVGLLGADGAGKTTLMQMLSAILDPSEGACRVLGFDTVKQSREVVSRIGYMPQGFSLYDRLSVSENLDFSASIRNVPPSVWKDRRDRLLAMTGLGQFAGRRAGQLSGGMRKKLALCANLVHEPPLLLLDEPSLGVDPLSRRELWKLLAEFRARAMTIVVATSYMDEAERCDRILFLERGRTLALGTPEELRARAANSVYEVSAPDLDIVESGLSAVPHLRSFKRLPDRFRVVTESGAQLPAALGAIRQVEPELEDVFALLEEERGASDALPIAPSQKHEAVVTIDAKDVVRRFGAFTALDQVSLTVRSGEVFGFLGPNGAGKTTLIKIFCGLLPPSSGTATVAGVDIVREARAVRSRIGYMSQRFSLYPDMTIAENLSFFSGAYGLKGEARSKAIAWAKAVTGLAGLEARFLDEISGAVRQRVALAASLMHRPDVLFLDEPTSGVDPVSRHRFWRLIRNLARSGMTVFVTTHYLEEAAFCDRLGLMLEGRLIADGTLAQLRVGLPQGSPHASVEDIFLGYIAMAQTERRAA